MGKEYKNYKKTSLHRVKDRRKYYKGREGKTEEIKRALGHRARLRKQYFKILRNEGEDIPNKSVNKDTQSCQRSLKILMLRKLRLKSLLVIRSV